MSLAPPLMARFGSSSSARCELFELVASDVSASVQDTELDSRKGQTGISKGSRQSARSHSERRVNQPLLRSFALMGRLRAPVFLLPAPSR